MISTVKSKLNHLYQLTTKKIVSIEIFWPSLFCRGRVQSYCWTQGRGGRSVGIKSNNILEDLWMRYISRRKDSTEGIPIGSIGATKLYSPYKEKNSRRVQSTKGRGYFGMRSLVRGWIVYWTVLIERPQTLFCKRVTAIRNWINFRRTSNSASRIQFLLRF